MHRRCALVLGAGSWVVLLLLLARPGPPVRGAVLAPLPTPAALDRAAYVARLHRALAEVDAGAAGSLAPPTAATRALDDLQPTFLVRDAGGPLAEVDTTALRALLESRPPDLAAARARLVALLDLLDPGTLPSRTPTAPAGTAGATVATPGPPATPAYLPGGGPGGPPLGPAEAATRLQRVLADPRFAPGGGSDIQTGLARLLDPAVSFFLTLPAEQRNLLIAAVSGLLVAFLVFSGYREAPWSRRRYRGTVAGSGAGSALLVYGLLTYTGAVFEVAGGVLFPVLAALGVLATLGVIGFGVLGLRGARAPAGTHLASAFAAEAGWTASQARAAAAAAAAALDYRGAVRYRYLATLLALDEAGRMRFDPALTNGEYLRRAPAPLGDVLRPLVQIFDRLWYGGYPATAGDYESYQALATRAEGPLPEPGG